jgi:hypothetical protein
MHQHGFHWGTSLSENRDLILVVVEKINKYWHFVSARRHQINVKWVAKEFIANIIKLHGLTSMDVIFTSTMWDLFKPIGVKLHFTTSYHPQTDGQIERLNLCHLILKIIREIWHSYSQRNGVGRCPLWGYFYTSFHTSLKTSPPQIAEKLLHQRTIKLTTSQSLPPERDSSGDHAKLYNSTRKDENLGWQKKIRKSTENWGYGVLNSTI